MFEKQKYVELILEGKLVDAEVYKMNKTPKTMYKYMSLSNSSECDNLTDLDEKKLSGINHNKIWMPLYSELNDPFEMKSLYYNKDILEEKGWKTNQIDSIFSMIKGNTLITSFTTSAYNNMPMWAHYSNNHSGICIEYEVVNPAWMYPVSYETKRVSINSILTRTINEIIKIDKEGKEDENSTLRIESNMYIISTLGALIKNKNWSYEEEWRLITKNISNNSISMDITSLGLKVKSIYIGINCREEVKNRLISICKNIKCDLYEMSFYEESEAYELARAKIDLD